MLRRTKAQIDLDIPKKTQQLVYVPLMPQQLFWYKALLTQTLPTFAPSPASSHAEPRGGGSSRQGPRAPRERPEARGPRCPLLTSLDLDHDQ